MKRNNINESCTIFLFPIFANCGPCGVPTCEAFLINYSFFFEFFNFFISEFFNSFISYPSFPFMYWFWDFFQLLYFIFWCVRFDSRSFLLLWIISTVIPIFFTICLNSPTHFVDVFITTTFFELSLTLLLNLKKFGCIFWENF